MSDELIRIPPEPSPLAMIDRLSVPGADPSQLKVLFDLYNAHEANLARRAWHEAMHRAQARMPCIAHDAKNPSTNSGYARLEKIQHICRPIWMEEGLDLSFAEDDCPLDGNRRIVCDVRHVRGHTVRYHRDIPMDAETPKGSPNAMTPPQRAVSTGSYGQRVLTCDIFDIVIARTDLDGQDGNASLSTEQIREINTLIDECQKAGRPVSGAAFFGWLKCENLEQVPAAKFGDIVGFLKKKRGGGK